MSALSFIGPHEVAFEVRPQDGKTRIHAVCLACGEDYAALKEGPDAESEGRKAAARKFVRKDCSPVEMGAA